MSTNGGSRNSVPFRVIPERGKVAENFVKSSLGEEGYVFSDDVARS